MVETEPKPKGELMFFSATIKTVVVEQALDIMFNIPESLDIIPGNHA